MINWGIIGAGNIAKKFAKTLESIDDSKLYAVSNRSIEKAKEFAEKYSCDMCYGSYEEILNDKNIEAVYISLPHSLHSEWSIKALKAGKAVLCEKPATLNFNEINKVINFAIESDTLYMEAMKGRFTPGYRKLKEFIEDGRIGEIKSISTSLCRVFPIDENSRLFDKNEGGCLLDMGVYNIGFVEDFIYEPYILESIDFKKYKDLAEIYVNANLSASGVNVSIESAFDRNKKPYAIIEGTKGKIIAEDFHRLTKFQLEVDGIIEKFDIPCEVNDFYHQIVHFTECLKSGTKQSPVMPFESSKNVAKMLDIIKSKIK